MIYIGESVGALDTRLDKNGDSYDEKKNQAVENLTAMIEPFMMVFLGGMIGGIVVAMYLPISKTGVVLGRLYKKDLRSMDEADKKSAVSV